MAVLSVDCYLLSATSVTAQRSSLVSFLKVCISSGILNLSCPNMLFSVSISKFTSSHMSLVKLDLSIQSPFKLWKCLSVSMWDCEIIICFGSNALEIQEVFVNTSLNLWISNESVHLYLKPKFGRYEQLIEPPRLNVLVLTAKYTFNAEIFSFIWFVAAIKNLASSFYNEKQIRWFTRNDM